MAVDEKATTEQERPSRSRSTRPRSRRSESETSTPKKSAPTRVPPTDKKLHTSVSGTYESLGLLAIGMGMARHDEGISLMGQQIVSNAEAAADAWLELANTNPSVKKALQRFTEGSAVANLVTVHIAMIVPLAASRGGHSPDVRQHGATSGSRYTRFTRYRKWQRRSHRGYSGSVMGVVEEIPWGSALRRMDWRQGEHITLIGPTGVGKTELMVALLEYHPWAVFFNTKRIDPTQDKLRSMGYTTIQRGRDLNPEITNRFILAPPWPRRLSPEALDQLHKREFVEGLTRAFWQTGWTVAIDELEYMNRDLRIESPVNKLLRQGRSQGNSLILGTQRPRHVTLHAYEQATHLFIWKQSDLANVSRSAEIAGIDRSMVLQIVPTLERHDVLYVNTINNTFFVTNTRWE